MDQEIHSLRLKFWATKSDNEALELLQQIDKLQRQRFEEKGSFLPHPDGKVYYYDFDYDRWFQMIGVKHAQTGS